MEMTQQEQAERYVRLAKEAERCRLEDDVRALEHWKAFGYIQHHVAREKLGHLIEALKGELKVLTSKEAS